MAACGSLEHIFENPLPENQTFLESLSPWKQKHLIKPDSSSSSSFTEIFGELHFKENNNNPPLSPPPPSPARPEIETPVRDSSPSSSSSSDHSQKKNHQYNHSDSFSSKKSGSNLSLCTEGLGFESFDDAEDHRTNNHICNDLRAVAANHHHRMDQFNKRSRICRSEYPPPISCIGRSGKPWVCFKSYREDGRFILKEIRIPTQEFLHACREDGRLRLQFISSDDEVFEGGDDDDEDEDEIGEKLTES